MLLEFIVYESLAIVRQLLLKVFEWDENFTFNTFKYLQYQIYKTIFNMAVKFVFWKLSKY